jgi:periplasmic protein TonB
VNLYATSPETLWSSPSFLRFTAYSSVAHVGVVLFVMYGSFFRFDSALPTIDVVEVSVLDAPPEPVAEPAPEPAPPEPPPPEPEPPPTPEVKPPEPAPEPEPPEQQVDEAVVIPDVPRDKPKPPKPPPKPPKRPDKKPKPPKPVDVSDVMKNLRSDVEQRTPKPQASSASGTVDPELAEYYRKVKVCLDANWVGAQRFQRRRDLEVQFMVEVDAGGQVKSLELTRGSGEDQLDDTAERAIRKCSASLPPPPAGRTRVPIAFNPGDIE